ncbi:MAG: hypothetical protein KKG92_05785 [Gammaproteobacteria bacterium]|nr:hypothetical protein [Gammaproteobacteria bacterium]
MLSMVTACPADDLSQTLTTRETLRRQEREQPLQSRTPDIRLQSPVPRAELERLPTGEFLSFNHGLGGGEPGRHGTCGYGAHYSLPFSDRLLSLSGGKGRYYQSAPGQTHIYSSESLLGQRLSGAVLGLRGGYQGCSWDIFAGRPLPQPQSFQTAERVLGFSLNWSS